MPANADHARDEIHTLFVATLSMSCLGLLPMHRGSPATLCRGGSVGIPRSKRSATSPRSPRLLHYDSVPRSFFYTLSCCDSTILFVYRCTVGRYKVYSNEQNCFYRFSSSFFHQGRLPQRSMLQVGFSTQPGVTPSPLRLAWHQLESLQFNRLLCLPHLLLQN